MTHAQFMAKPENRARYWHRSFCGWPEFAGVQPNTGAPAGGGGRGAGLCTGESVQGS